MALVAIFFVVFLGWFATGFWSTDAREAREVEEYFKNIEEQNKNDTYGGATPEETLQLFIAALEAEDIELASKYFLPDEREDIQGYFMRARDDAGGFDRFIRDSKALKLSKNDGERAFYTIVDENKVVEVQVILKKNQNNVWKITDL